MLQHSKISTTHSSNSFENSTCSNRLKTSLTEGAPLPRVEDFVLMKPITKGGFGKVYLGSKRKDYLAYRDKKQQLENNNSDNINQSDNENDDGNEDKENSPPPPPMYAIKIMKKEELDQKNMLSSVVRERKALALSKSPFTVHLYYSLLSDDLIVLVMEYMVGGDLSALLGIYAKSGKNVIYTGNINYILFMRKFIKQAIYAYTTTSRY